MATGDISFFEEDEPIEDIRAILNRPVDGVTHEPTTRITGIRHFTATGTTEAFAVEMIRTLPVRTLPRAATARCISA